MNRPVLLLTLLLALSFFGLVDGQVRGWGDTHQYQAEAKAWDLGSRPPLKEYQQLRGLVMVGPTHTPPLIPFQWSLLKPPSLPSETPSGWLMRIRALQAFLIAFSFIGLVGVLSRWRFSWSALAIGILVYCTEFWRSLIHWPMTEPLSVGWITLSALVPGSAAMAAAFQAVTRPPVTVLMALPTLRVLRNWRALAIGLAVGVACLAGFRELIIPSKFDGFGMSAEKTVRIFSAFSNDLAHQWFHHLFRSDRLWFRGVFGVALSVSVLHLMVRTRKHWVLWASVFAYLAVIQLPDPLGVRYFMPAVVLLLLELKPQLPGSRKIRLAVAIVCVHLVLQQGSAIRGLWKAGPPEEDLPGLRAARAWIMDPAQSGIAQPALMSHYFSHCINYFRVSCYPTYPNWDQSLKTIRERKIDFAVMRGLAWIVEDSRLESQLRQFLGEKELERRTRRFGEASLIDLRGL